MIAQARTKTLKQLEQLIGYEFSNFDLLDKALTHSSAGASARASARSSGRAGGPDPKQGNYERLEFLGDRILGLCIAELLFGRFSDAKEGELSVRLNNLVSAEACASIADELDLYQYIITGSDVQNITSDAMLNVRADVVESLIAAIYLDGGLEAARAFILKFWSSRALSKSSIRRDAKTELQEWSHARYKMPPIYKVLSRDGPDHAPVFTVEVTIDKLEPAMGKSGSKRSAEQMAAETFLIREGIWGKDD